MTAPDDQAIFLALKKQVSQKLRKRFPEIPPDMEQWKGSDIARLQDDLMQHVNDRISEKWFYTYFKKKDPPLPRIDMLDLLCVYCAYEDWQSFKRKQVLSSQRKPGKAYIVFAVILLLLVSSAFYFSRSTVTFVINDAYTLQPIAPDKLRVFVIEGDQEYQRISYNDGYAIRRRLGEITVAVQHPYYHDDTLRCRIGWFDTMEFFVLYPDDYALMIDYISRSDLENWNNRRTQLQAVFDDDAMIFQVNSEEKLMAVYNKEEFINRLSLPLQRLRNVEVRETRFRDGKINYLRFTSYAKEDQ